MYSHSIVHRERALMAPCLQSHFLSLLCNSFLMLMTLIPSILCFSRIQRCPCTQRTSTAAEESMNNVLLFNRFFSWYIELEERKKLPCRCDPQFRRCQHCETFFSNDRRGISTEKKKQSWSCSSPDPRFHDVKKRPSLLTEVWLLFHQEKKIM